MMSDRICKGSNGHYVYFKMVDVTVGQTYMNYDLASEGKIAAELLAASSMKIELNNTRKGF